MWSSTNPPFRSRILNFSWVFASNSFIARYKLPITFGSTSKSTSTTSLQSFNEVQIFQTLAPGQRQFWSRAARPMQDPTKEARTLISTRSSIGTLTVRQTHVRTTSWTFPSKVRHWKNYKTGRRQFDLIFVDLISKSYSKTLNCSWSQSFFAHVIELLIHLCLVGSYKALPIYKFSLWIMLLIVFCVFNLAYSG